MNKEILNGLINLSLNKDEAAFRKIVEYFQGLVYSFAFRMLCDEDEAKDIIYVAGGQNKQSYFVLLSTCIIFVINLNR